MDKREKISVEFEAQELTWLRFVVGKQPLENAKDIWDKLDKAYKKKEDEIRKEGDD